MAARSMPNWSLVAHEAVLDGDGPTDSSFRDARWPSTRAMSVSGSIISTQDKVVMRSTRDRSFLRFFKKRKRRSQARTLIIPDNDDQSCVSVRTSRLHVPDSKPLLSRQKAVVYCRPSLALEPLDNGGSLSDSECTCATSFARQSSRISALTLPSIFAPAGKGWAQDPFEIPQVKQNLIKRRADEEDKNSTSSEPSCGLMAIEVDYSNNDDFSVLGALSTASCQVRPAHPNTSYLEQSTRSSKEVHWDEESMRREISQLRTKSSNINLISDDEPSHPRRAQSERTAPFEKPELEVRSKSEYYGSEAKDPMNTAEAFANETAMRETADSTVDRATEALGNGAAATQSNSQNVPIRFGSRMHVMRKMDFADLQGPPSPRRPSTSHKELLDVVKEVNEASHDIHHSGGLTTTSMQVDQQSSRRTNDQIHIPIDENDKEMEEETLFPDTQPPPPPPPPPPPEIRELSKGQGFSSSIHGFDCTAPTPVASNRKTPTKSSLPPIRSDPPEVAFQSVLKSIKKRDTRKKNSEWCPPTPLYKPAATQGSQQKSTNDRDIVFASVLQSIKKSANSSDSALRQPDSRGTKPVRTALPAQHGEIEFQSVLKSIKKRASEDEDSVVQPVMPSRRGS